LPAPLVTATELFATFGTGVQVGADKLAVLSRLKPLLHRFFDGLIKAKKIAEKSKKYTAYALIAESRIWVRWRRRGNSSQPWDDQIPHANTEACRLRVVRVPLHLGGLAR